MARIRFLWRIFGLYIISGLFIGCAVTPAATAPSQAAEPPRTEVLAKAPAEEPEEAQSVVNILLLGVDSWDTLSGRSDAIVMVSVDLDHERVLLTSVPRDLRVSLGELPQPQRINAAYAYGGAELARATLERVLDVEIPYYAVVNFAGFARIIDTLGGVTVDVPENIVDLQFPAVDGIEYEPFVLLAGVHHFDGETALKYARTRKSSENGDFSRMDRQHQVMRALKAQALTPRTLLRIPALYRDFRHAVDTNISLEIVLRLAKAAGSIDGESVEYYAIDEASGLVTPQMVDGMFLLEPDLVGIRTALSERISQLAEVDSEVVRAAGS